MWRYCRVYISFLQVSGGEKDKGKEEAPPATGNYTKFNYNGEPLPPGVDRQGFQTLKILQDFNCGRLHYSIFQA